MSACIASIAWSAELSTLAARFGSAPAVSDGIKAISYTELARNAHEVAGQLTLRRIAPGEPVGTLLPNGTATVWTSYGVTLSGACETLVSWNSTEAETLWAVSLAKCRLMVTTKQREAALRSMGVVAAAEGASDIWEAEAERRVAVLSKHKRPRLWIALEALPRNAQGKVSRRELRERILAQYALIDGPHPRLVPLRQQ